MADDRERVVAELSARLTDHDLTGTADLLAGDRSITVAARDR